MNNLFKVTGITSRIIETQRWLKWVRNYRLELSFAFHDKPLGTVYFLTCVWIALLGIFFLSKEKGNF